MTNPITYLGELDESGYISIEMRDRFVGHYAEHRHHGCAGFHSCSDFRRTRERWAIERNGILNEFSDDDEQPAVCPRCGAELVQRASRRTGDPFIGCSAFPECDYIYRARKAA